MQSPAVPATAPRAPDAAQVNTQRLLALGAGPGDFLSLLKQSEATPADLPKARPEPERGEPPRQGEEPPRRREREASEDLALVGAPQPGSAQRDPLATSEQRAQANAALAPAMAPAEKPQPGLQAAPETKAPETRAPEIKATVEPAGIDSRPRAVLTAGTSPVALAAQDQPQVASAAAETASRTTPSAQGQQAAEQAGQRLDLSQLAREVGRGREAGGPLTQTNTTLAGLEAMAEKAAQKVAAAAGQNGGQAGGHAGGQTASQPHQQALAQAAQSGALSGAQSAAQSAAQGAGPAQAAAGLATVSAPAGKPQAFIQSLAGLDSLTGAPANATPAKTDTAAAPKASAPAARTPQPAVDQVAVQIQKAASAGKDRIQIKLNPAELGRVDVKLEFQADGGVRAVVAVERPETLELLQRDARGLERALADAGFKTGQTSLSFEMQTGGQGGNGSFGDELAGRGREETAPAPGANAPEPAPETQAVEATPVTATAAGGVDIRI